MTCCCDDWDVYDGWAECEMHPNSVVIDARDKFDLARRRAELHDTIQRADD